MAENKVRFNIKNAHYAVLTESVGTGGAITYSYGTPVKIPGAVSIDISAQGNSNDFYADGIVYYATRANNGYSGNLTVARIPDAMMKDVFGMTETNTSKVLVERSNALPKEFALLFQIDGNDSPEFFVLYRCNATRPGVNGNTNTDSINPDTVQIEINAIPRGDNLVFARTKNDTQTSTKSGWFSSVFTPEA